MQKEDVCRERETDAAHFAPDVPVERGDREKARGLAEGPVGQHGIPRKILQAFISFKQDVLVINMSRKDAIDEQQAIRRS